MTINFKRAMGILTRRVEHEEIARQMGVSRSTIRQALLPEDAKSFRNPPATWADWVELLAQARITELQDLIQMIRRRHEKLQARAAASDPDGSSGGERDQV